jgi:AraC-like DNA-binding protein
MSRVVVGPRSLSSAVSEIADTELRGESGAGEFGDSGELAPRPSGDVYERDRTPRKIPAGLNLRHPALHFRFIEYLFRSARSLRRATGLLPRYAPLLGELTEFRVDPKPEGVEIHHRLLGQRGGFGAEGNETLIMLLVELAREQLGETWVPPRVWFAHSRNERSDALAQYLGVEPAYDAATSGLLVDNSVLDVEFLSSEPELNELLVRYLEEKLPAGGGAAFVARVENAIADSLAQRRKAVLDVVSQKFRMSSRTLQRRLRENGVAFQEVLDSVRSRRARQLLLETRLSLRAIAFKLGYAHDSPFIRAFERWHKVTPNEFRAAHVHAQTQRADSG